MAGVLWPLDNEQQPLLGKFPHSLRVVGKRRRRRAEQPLIPGQRCREVGDWYAREQVKTQSTPPFSVSVQAQGGSHGMVAFVNP
jgi:hypothetical protein